MGEINITGINEVETKLNSLQINTEKIAHKTLYKGAGVVADAIKEKIQALPTDESYGTTEKPKIGPTNLQKQAMAESMGIAPMKQGKEGTTTSIGFDGYNKVRTKRWPQGQPNAMVARSVERGTTFMKANKFMKEAVQAAKSKAIEAMSETAEEEINKIMK